MPVKSISDLRAELASKEKQLATLESRRSALVKELDKVDRVIASLAGKAGKVGAVRRVVKAPGKAAISRRRATGKPLAAYITDVLKPAKGGLSVTNVVKAVTKAGYKSHSKDFYAIVAKTLLTDDRFRRIKRGIYTQA